MSAACCSLNPIHPPREAGRQPAGPEVVIGSLGGTVVVVDVVVVVVLVVDVVVVVVGEVVVVVVVVTTESSGSTSRLIWNCPIDP